MLDSTAGVDGGRTTATLVALIAALWTLLILCRPLAGWKLALVVGMAGVAALAVAIPPIATNHLLLHPNPLRVLIAAIAGVAAAALIEITTRVQARGAASSTPSIGQPQ